MDGKPVSISVRDLAGQPHLRIAVIAGAAGLDRAITWAHSSDLPEPWDWMSGGELLMKNGRTLAAGAKGQAALVEGLASAGAAGLVIGIDPDTPPVSPRAVALADRLGLPVLTVPYSVGFIVLSRAVADALTNEESIRLAKASRIYATIRAGVTDSDPAAFVGRLEAELDCQLSVVDTETCSIVLDGTRPLPERVQASLASALTSRGRAVPGVLRVDPRDPHTAIAVEVPYEEPTLLVAWRPDGRSFDMVLLQHAATAIAVEVAHASLRGDHQRQLGTELLAQLLDAQIDAVTAGRQLRDHSLEPATARLLASRGATADDQRRLHIGLRRRHIDHLLIRRDGVLLVLLAAAGAAEPPVPVVQSRLGSSAIGISNPLGDPLRAPEALREAMWALAVASERADRLASYGGAAPLPALRDPAEAQALVDRVLGRLVVYDRANNSDLLQSLAAFLACRRSWQRTAERLSVHRQTVVYRLARVEQLTGRTLAETADLAELWLALRALEMLTGSPVLAGRSGGPG